MGGDKMRAGPALLYALILLYLLLLALPWLMAAAAAP